jgi:hypothetical protein
MPSLTSLACGDDQTTPYRVGASGANSPALERDGHETRLPPLGCEWTQIESIQASMSSLSFIRLAHLAGNDIDRFLAFRGQGLTGDLDGFRYAAASRHVLLKIFEEHMAAGQRS